MTNKSQPIGIIPKIVTEDFDSDTKVSSSNDSEELSWKSDKVNGGQLKNNFTECETNIYKVLSKSSGSVRVNTTQTSRGTTFESTSTMTDTHPSHYHTVHGTSVSQGHYYGDGNGSPLYTMMMTPNKQRTRSHSGPTYPLGFTQQVRHSALISAGIAPTATATARVLRRQSDDSETASTSLRSRVSPNGSSFFDTFR